MKKYRLSAWERNYRRWYENQSKNEFKIAVAQAKLLKYNANGYLEASRKYLAILRWAWVRPINRLNNEIVIDKMIKAGLYRPRNFWSKINRPVVPREYKTI